MNILNKLGGSFCCSIGTDLLHKEPIEPLEQDTGPYHVESEQKEALIHARYRPLPRRRNITSYTGYRVQACFTSGSRTTCLTRNQTMDLFSSLNSSVWFSV
jgi:hypothetical protein